MGRIRFVHRQAEMEAVGLLVEEVGELLQK